MPTANLLVSQGGRQAVALKSSEMVEARRGVWSNYFGRGQSEFGVYSTMTVSSRGKHLVNYITGNPLMVRDRTICDWNPDKVFTSGQYEVDPSDLAVQTEVCLGSDFNSAFKIFEEFRNNEVASFPDGLVDTFFNEAGFAIGRGTRFHIAAGGLYATTSAQAGTDADTVALWAKARNAHTGWAKYCVDNAGTVPHLNVDVYAAATSFTEIYDNLINGATPKMKAVMNVGGLYTAEGYNRVTILVSPAYYSLAVEAERTEAVNPMQNRRRYEWQEVNGTRYLMLDRHPIIIEDVFQLADEITGSTTFAMAVSVAGIINAGTSFIDNTVIFDKDAGAGLVFQMGTDLKDAGKLYIAGDQLVSTVISDTDYIVANVEIVDPV